MKFWVSGATGFLGSTLLRALRAQGHEVVATSRSGGKIDDVEVQAVDLFDSAAVQKSAHGTDGAFLAFGKVSRDPRDEEEMYRVHVQATKATLAGLRAAGVRRAVVASTSGTIAIGRDPKPRRESDPVPHELISRWPYYRSKWYGEQAALEANDPPHFDVVITNPSQLLGPGDARGTSNRDVRLFLSGRLPALPQGGLAFIDVRDAALGMILAFHKGKPGERYLLSGANIPLGVYFGRLSRLSGVPLPKLQMPKNPALACAAFSVFAKAAETLGKRVPVHVTSVEMGAHFWYCDTTKAETELGFKPRPVEDTLRETVQEIQQATEA